MPRQANPLANTNFLVEIEGIGNASFCRVSGIESLLEVVRAEDGRDPWNAPNKPERAHFTPVTLQRAATADRELWQWYQKGLDRKPERRALKITILDANRERALTIDVKGAWPCRWKLTALDARDGEILLEEVDLAIDTFTIA